MICAGMQVDFGQMQTELFMPESVSAWFALDCKLGSLMLGLEPPACFGADVYGFDLGILDPEDDQRFNYGEHLLRAAFVYWSTRYSLHDSEWMLGRKQQQGGTLKKTDAAFVCWSTRYSLHDSEWEFGWEQQQGGTSKKTDAAFAYWSTRCSLPDPEWEFGWKQQPGDSMIQTETSCPASPCCHLKLALLTRHEIWKHF